MSNSTDSRKSKQDERDEWVEIALRRRGEDLRRLLERIFPGESLWAERLGVDAGQLSRALAGDGDLWITEVHQIYDALMKHGAPVKDIKNLICGAWDDFAP